MKSFSAICIAAAIALASNCASAQTGFANGLATGVPYPGSLSSIAGAAAHNALAENGSLPASIPLAIAPSEPIKAYSLSDGSTELILPAGSTVGLAAAGLTTANFSNATFGKAWVDAGQVNLNAGDAETSVIVSLVPTRSGLRMDIDTMSSASREISRNEANAKRLERKRMVQIGTLALIAVVVAGAAWIAFASSRPSKRPKPFGY